MMIFAMLFRQGKRSGITSLRRMIPMTLTELHLIRELLRRFYLSEGYADFRVDAANAEMAPDRSAFFITFNVTEGRQYKFAKPNINIGLRDLKTYRNCHLF